MFDIKVIQKPNGDWVLLVEQYEVFVATKLHQGWQLVSPVNPRLNALAPNLPDDKVEELLWRIFDELFSDFLDERYGAGTADKVKSGKVILINKKDLLRDRQN